ncbi:MAG: NAD/NADP octopine/nopaline dehydrogenase family protein [Firmicutes bacterium]|nr:NAD/NADP octopine/nopaline dehydrogenase family protein [Bacillota bacterium]
MVDRDISFAVIGGGNGGKGIAAYLANMGHKVNLYNRTFDKIRKIKELGFIEIEGTISGRGYMDRVTDKIEEAINDVDIIMIATTANAHKYIAREIAPYVTDKQYIVLNPGRTGGALEMLKIIKSINSFRCPCIVEAQTLLFACRAIGEDKINILKKKNHVKVAAMPAIRTKEFINKIHHIIPEFVDGGSVLDTSFNNIGAILHPIPTILNCGRIEDTKGDFLHYIEGITPSVGKIIGEADNERIRIAEMLGVRPMPLIEWLGYTYDAYGTTVCDALHMVTAYMGIKAPGTLDTRYISEDVPQSLVPIADMGQYLGVETPVINSIIHLSSIIHSVDYARTGRKISDMGLDGLTLDGIRSFVSYGEIFESEGEVV